MIILRTKAFRDFKSHAFFFKLIQNFVNYVFKRLFIQSKHYYYMSQTMSRFIIVEMNLDQILVLF